jgi:hypothetical protein
MEVDDGGANPKTNSSADADWLHLDELPRPFDIVCDDLTGLGALSIEDFLSNTSSAGFDVSFHLQLPEILAAEKEKEHEREKENAGKPVDDAGEEIPPAPKVLKPVALLRQTGQAVFGSSDRLNYEFLEEDGKSMSFFFFFCLLRGIQIVRPIFFFQSNVFSPLRMRMAQRGRTNRILHFHVEQTPNLKLHRSRLIWALSISSSRAIRIQTRDCYSTLSVLNLETWNWMNLLQNRFPNSQKWTNPSRKSKSVALNGGLVRSNRTGWHLMILRIRKVRIPFLLWSVLLSVIHRTRYGSADLIEQPCLSCVC